MDWIPRIWQAITGELTPYLAGAVSTEESMQIPPISARPSSSINTDPARILGTSNWQEKLRAQDIDLAGFHNFLCRQTLVSPPVLHLLFCGPPKLGYGQKWSLLLLLCQEPIQLRHLSTIDPRFHLDHGFVDQNIIFFTRTLFSSSLISTPFLKSLLSFVAWFPRLFSFCQVSSSRFMKQLARIPAAEGPTRDCHLSVGLWLQKVQMLKLYPIIRGLDCLQG